MAMSLLAWMNSGSLEVRREFLRPCALLSGVFTSKRGRATVIEFTYDIVIEADVLRRRHQYCMAQNRGNANNLLMRDDCNYHSLLCIE